MKNTIKLILIMVFLFSSLRANATVIMENSEVKSIISKQVADSYKNYTDAEISVEVVTLPFKNLSLPDGKVSFVIESPSDKFMARTLEKVSVYVNNRFVKTFNAPIVVKVYENILVASSFINIGQQIGPNVANAKRVEISNIFGYQLNANSINKDIMAKKAFREGEIIDKRFVKVKPEILRNANVTVFFNTNNLTVSTEAIALSDGIIGDNICLMNKNYNRTYKGTVIGANKVLVKI